MVQVKPFVSLFSLYSDARLLLLLFLFEITKKKLDKLITQSALLNITSSSYLLRCTHTEVIRQHTTIVWHVTRSHPVRMRKVPRTAHTHLSIRLINRIHLRFYVRQNFNEIKFKFYYFCINFKTHCLP